MGIVSTYTEGGQTWSHRVRMMRQVLRSSLLIALLVSLGVLAYLASDLPTHYWQAAYYSCKAQLLSSFFDTIEVGAYCWGKISNQRFHGVDFVSLECNQVLRACAPFVSHCLWVMEQAINSVLFAFVCTFLGVNLFFLARGVLARKKVRVSGLKVVSGKRLAASLRFRRKASDFSIGGVPLLKGTETQHILVSGGTGSGKTQCFHSILPSVRKKGRKAVIVDTTGVFVDRYYRYGKDTILNPLDERSACWSPWAEGTDEATLRAVSKSFIPSSFLESENYWRQSAQIVFSEMLKQHASSSELKMLKESLFRRDLKNFCLALRDTKAQAVMDFESERTAASIRSVLTSFTESIESLSDDKDCFSIKEWTRSEDDSWLFLTCTPSQRDTLSGLLTAQLSITIKSLMDLSPSLDRQIWFVIDELPSLGKVSHLDTFVCEARKYGGCGLISIQSPSQLDHIYGQHLSKILLGNCSTKVALRELDPDAAERVSRLFGSYEEMELQEGLSYGSHAARDGVSLSRQRRQRPSVSPSDLQSLPQLQGYVKLPSGTLPIGKFKI